MDTYNLKEPLKAAAYEKGMEDGFAKLGPRDYPEIIKAWFPDAKMDFSESFMIPYINFGGSAFVIGPGDMILFLDENTKLPFTKELFESVFGESAQENVRFSKRDLIAMVKGSAPSYGHFEDPLIKNRGRYIGGFTDKWEWDSSALEKLTEEELHAIYQICKLGWGE